MHESAEGDASNRVAKNECGLEEADVGLDVVRVQIVRDEGRLFWG